MNKKIFKFENSWNAWSTVSSIKIWLHSWGIFTIQFFIKTTDEMSDCTHIVYVGNWHTKCQPAHLLGVKLLTQLFYLWIYFIFWVFLFFFNVYIILLLEHTCNYYWHIFTNPYSFKTWVPSQHSTPNHNWDPMRYSCDYSWGPSHPK